MSQYSRKLAKGTFWYYKFDFKGQTYFSKAIYKTKQEAKRGEAARLNDIQKAPKPDEPIDTLTAISERLKHLRITASKKYYLDNSHYLELFRNYFKQRVLNNITTQEVHTFIYQMAENLVNKGKSNYTINAAIRCYKAFYNFVNEFYMADLSNPFLKTKFFPITKRIKYIPTDDEINAVLAICSYQQALLIKFVMETGARINEALNLTYGDITDGQVILYTNKTKGGNRTPRKLPLPECFKDIIKGKFKDRVFNLWTDRPKFLDKKLRKLNLPLWGWHNLRHRFASKMSKNGTPIFEMMSLLGHQNLETTQLYLQLLP